MANVGAYAQKALLDWVLLGATPTRPSSVGVGLALGAPTSVSGSEVGNGSGYTKQLCVFAAAASPAGSASNTNAMTFGPFSSAASISGLIVTDTTATAGNILFYGPLATPRTVNPGDSIVIASGSLTITMS